MRRFATFAEQPPSILGLKSRNLIQCFVDVRFVSLFVIRRWIRKQLFTFRHLAQLGFPPVPLRQFCWVLTFRPFCKETY